MRKGDTVRKNPPVGIAAMDVRKSLLVKMEAKAKGPRSAKVLPFGNNDVPKFLSRLDKFEARSTRCSIIVM
jgi:hypothetical protein